MDSQNTSAFIEDLKSRALFENFASIVSNCTHSCVRKYDQMYLEQQEEQCVRQCFKKNFEFQSQLNQELTFLVRNL